MRCAGGNWPRPFARWAGAHHQHGAPCLAVSAASSEILRTVSGPWSPLAPRLGSPLPEAVAEAQSGDMPVAGLSDDVPGIIFPEPPTMQLPTSLPSLAVIATVPRFWQLNVGGWPPDREV